MNELEKEYHSRVLELGLSNKKKIEQYRELKEYHTVLLSKISMLSQEETNSQKQLEIKKAI